MKKSFFLSILAAFMTFGAFSSLTSAGWGGYGSSEGPPNWGPWYLYQANHYQYTIECVYKRKEIKASGSGSIMTETERVQIPRYPYGRCADTITF